MYLASLPDKIKEINLMR